MEPRATARGGLTAGYEHRALADCLAAPACRPGFRRGSAWTEPGGRREALVRSLGCRRSSLPHRWNSLARGLCLSVCQNSPGRIDRENPIQARSIAMANENREGKNKQG